MTDITDRKTEKIGVLLYDGSCSRCVKWAQRIDLLLGRRGLVLLPFENGVNEKEMRLSLDDGREFGGADAAWVLSGKIWWANPIWLLGWLPGVLPLMRFIYRKIAAGRHCGDGDCEISKRITTKGEG